jgi:flagellar biosynthesis/type III secretory pathway protein FliH
MVLPEDLGRRFDNTMAEFEEEKRMTYISSTERRALKRGMEQGIEQGMEQGIQQGIQQGMEKAALQSRRETLLDILAVRFGNVPESLLRVIDGVAEVSRLKQLLRSAATAGSLTEFQVAMEGLS